MDGLMDGWMDGRICGWFDEWESGQMDGGCGWMYR